MLKIFLNSDGGSRGNPGNAGAGAVVSDESGKALKEVSQPLGKMTNNEAEYHALVLGLEAIKKLLGKDKMKQVEVVARLDSELVVRQLLGQYQIKEEKMQGLFIKVWNLKVADFPHLTFVHIPREENSLADKLANDAMDQASAKGLF